MDLLSYLNKRVHIKLANGFFYIGLVVNATQDDVDLIDKTSRQVSISKKFILSIEEVQN